MDRRSFISLLPATITASQMPVSFAAESQSRSVETTEERFRYLQLMLRRLCGELGPRPAGSKSFEKGIHIINDEFAASCPTALLDEYRFDKWELLSKPVIRVGEIECETFPFHGCKGTGKDGVTGTITKDVKGYPYALIDAKTGEPGVLLSVSAFGQAIPRSAYSSKELIPIIGIGKYDRDIFEKAAADKISVHATVKTRIVPNMPSWNAVGNIPGKRPDEILFFAHADTVYPSPGANDNTASAITMLMLAHTFSLKPQDYTLTFVASGNEENDSFGASHYAERRKKEGTFQSIKFIVQMDSLTYGPDLILTSKDEELRSLIRQINTVLEIKGSPRDVDSDAFIMDAEPFRDSGARAIYINSRGYDGVTLPLYHRPEDVPETVAFDCVDNSFHIFSEFIERIQTIAH